jgi:hypothetical protein
MVIKYTTTAINQSISTCGQVKELLNNIEKSMVCEGLPDDFTVKSVTTVPIPRAVIRHSIPHVPSLKQFEATYCLLSI